MSNNRNVYDRLKMEGHDVRSALLSVAAERDLFKKQLENVQHTETLRINMPNVQSTPSLSTTSPVLAFGTNSSYLHGEEQRLRRKLQQTGDDKYEVWGTSGSRMEASVGSF